MQARVAPQPLACSFTDSFVRLISLRSVTKEIHHENCAECIRQLFVAKSRTVPAGHAVQDVVHEEDLPNTLRSIYGLDGIGSMDLDSSRLTLLLGESVELVQTICE